MAAYAVAEIRWDEQQGLDRYLKMVQNALTPFGGRYLAFGPATVVEGKDAPTHVALVEFPSMADAKRFYESDQYGLPRKIRALSAKTGWVVFVDGLKI